ncbi:MAG: NAD(P)-dependent oxidoreductase [Duncaniella sp.]|nr:NAD(P)-dependent oxidoreductase [Duncaniella sp.]
MKSVLIVGAGGFIGGYIAAEGLRRGYDVWCAVRESTSRRFLTDPSLKFITLDYDSPQAMAEALKGHSWDYVVYNLGATKCVNFNDFNRINYNYLCDFTRVYLETVGSPRRFLYMSSLSALGPGDETHYTPLSSKSIPAPNTRYGVSKIKAETFLETLPELPWIILRPTGVYGPHEQDYLMMIKCIDAHFDFGVGFRRQLLTFIYVEDLARAVFDAVERSAPRRKYIISEPKAYSQSQFRRIVARALGRKVVIPIRLPLWALAIACKVSEKWGAAKMQPTTLNSDKYHILEQRNWNCDVSDAVDGFGFSPRIDLDRGIRLTVEAYRNAKNPKSDA